MGIGIGAACGAAMLASLTFFLFRFLGRKRRERSNNEGFGPANEAPEVPDVENAACRDKSKHELDEVEINELESPRAEMEDQIARTISELASLVVELDEGDGRNQVAR